MVENIYDIIYSFGLFIAFCILLIIIKLINRKRIMIVFLIISIPSFILCRTYFWNFTFNSYVKSYLFASENFACEFEKDLENLTIPLPKRTIFQAKEDGCSPFYITYISESEFQSFYEKELTQLKISELIQNYHFIQEGVRGQKDRSGFFVELATGANIVISLQTSKDMYRLSIAYVRDN